MKPLIKFKQTTLLVIPLVLACLSILTVGTAHAQDADLFASINHEPSGPGAIYEYTPTGVQSTFVASVVQPRGLAFDCPGNLYVAITDVDDNGNFVGSILKVTPGGTVSTVTSNFPLNFFLEDIKFDSMGNLFVMATNENDPNGASTIFKVSPAGGVSTFGSVPFQGFGLGFDSMGNLYAASGDPAIYKFTRAGMRSVFAGPSAFLPNQGPTGLAFDSAGNLFVSTEGNSPSDSILEFTPAGMETTFATGLPNNPRGLAFDSAGNLFVAEIPGDGPGDILEFAPVGGAPTLFAAGIGRPQGNGGPEYLAFARPCQFTSSIASNFNGTQINSGSTIWFSSVLKPSGLGSQAVTFRFTNQTISSTSFATVAVPDAQVIFDPAAAAATTTFTGGMWVTRVPATGLAGNTFFSAVSFPVTANIPGGAKNITWSGTISSDTATASLQWQWGAAVYTSFSADYNAVGVKPVDDNKASVYKNSDHAGTPENFKAYVTGGATGGGGSNYTGGLSGTVRVGPCCSP